MSTNSRSVIFLTNLGGKDQFCRVIGLPVTAVVGVTDMAADMFGCKVVKVDISEV